MHVTMKNPATGELKRIKIGFSWVLFLFSTFLGIPLFLRKLYMLGALMVGWNLLELLGTPSDPQLAGAYVLIQVVTQLGLMIWLGLKGNEYTAKNYLERGWQLTQPDAVETRYALQVWGSEPPATAMAPSAAPSSAPSAAPSSAPGASQ